MKMTGHKLLGHLNDYFSRGDYETEIFLLLILPAFIFTLVLLLYKGGEKGEKDGFTPLSDKDFEILENIRQQKGLEEFDRDFLINLAATNAVKPIHLLINKEIFERVERILREELAEEGKNPAQNKNMIYLSKLKKKLFSAKS